MNKDILFLENFYNLLNAGYSVEESLSLCQFILNDSRIKKMKNDLKRGVSVDHIILKQNYPKIFKEYFHFYQNKNCLSEAIEKSLQIYHMNIDYQNKLKSKFTYPLILFVFLFLFSIFVVTILLPNVNSLFDSFELKKTLIIRIIFLFFSLFPYLFIIVSILFVIFLVRLLYGLKYKKFRIIEQYLKFPFLRLFLQKYFSLKFAIYYQELAKEDLDSATIIYILNKQMIHSDIKIVLYEMNNRMLEGETIEELLNDFEYFDQLFITFFKMYIQNPYQHQSIENYIQLTYQQLDQWISTFLKYFVPIIYSFVAIFVITVYISIIIPMMNVISDI